MKSSLSSVFPGGFEGRCFQRLVENRVLVAAFVLDDWRPWMTDAFAILDASERQRMQRQRQEQHRNDLALTYALRRLFLARVLGLPAAHVPLGRDVRGRPLLGGMAAETSLSHADGYAAVAVSMQGPVGVDIEPVHRAGVMPEIAAQICHGDERSLLAGPDGEGPALLRLWVRKEAFLKAAGVGLEREMDTFALPEGQASALHPGQAEAACVELLELGPATVCAVARRPEVACIGGWLRPTLGDS